MRPSRILPVLLALAAPACVPVVTHGPRVQPGTTVGSTLALGTRPTLETDVKTGQSNVTPVGPPMGVFARHGWTREDSGAPVDVSAGVFVSMALPFSVLHPELDLYAQVTPTEQRMAAGGGVLVSPSYVSPYVQLGSDRDGRGLYTTQSIALFRGSGPRATVWMPAVAVHAEGFHLFVQGGLGRETLADASTRQVRFVMAGFAIETRTGPLPARF